jgi:endonuclease/exonuclease/phosphatase family metal-dependent hydrolase
MKGIIVASFIFFAVSAKAQTRLKVLSYNVYHGEQPYNLGQPNIDSIAKVINLLKPDFVALQEVDSATGRLEKLYGTRINLVQVLAEKTGMYGYFGKAMDYDGGGYGEGLLSRFADTAEVITLGKPKGGEERAMIYVRHTFENGQKIIFAGTHLCHEFIENRVAQAAKINSVFEDSKVPVILLGDLNTLATDATYAEFAKHWQDAAVLKGKPQHTFSFRKLTKRLDYGFLLKGFKWKVVNVETPSYNYSDHLPIFFTVEIK